ncbi:eukaryotic translation initiation factor 2 subunit 2-like protein, partial [Dinothrombium tinctorium]
IFDPSMKKKKKSKKTIDASFFENDESKTTPQQQLKEEVVTDTVDAIIESKEKDLEDINDLLSTKKKKKKPKKPFNFEEMEGALQEADDSTPLDAPNQVDNGVSATNDGDQQLEDDDLDFNFTKKKKKKKRNVNFEESGQTEETAAAGEEGDTVLDEGDKENDADAAAQSVNSSLSSGPSAWANSDRDYTYEELLQHVFNIIREKNPDIIAGEKKRLVMRPPQVLRVGTKKTSFANFIDICKSLHRQPRHMQSFLLAELGTSGSVDANNQLIIKGRFQQKQIESVLRRYIKEYVACQTCRSPETLLQKDTRLFFLQCETCGSRRSVASIKSGFQAVTGKRAAIRAKAA